jgi:FkbM family methyltransferase
MRPVTRADVQRSIVSNPGDPTPYASDPTLRFGLFPPATLVRMAQRLDVLDPGNAEARNQFDNAVRLHKGRKIRRSVLPSSAETRTVSFDGLTMRFQCGEGPSRLFFERVLVEGTLHEPGLLRYLRLHVCPGDLLVDIGAHIGYVSCFAAAFGATVLAVEMQPTLIPVVAANAAMNNLWTVHPVNAAAGSSPGLVQTLRFDPSPGLMAHSERLRNNDFPPGSVNHDLIMRVAVDDLVLAGRPPPAFVKIDVEGAEGLVVAGCRRLIAAENTRFLVEVHPTLLTRFGPTLSDILDSFPRDRWSARLLREDGSTDDVPAETYSDEAVRADNYMIVFEPLSLAL